MKLRDYHNHLPTNHPLCPGGQMGFTVGARGVIDIEEDERGLVTITFVPKIDGSIVDGDEENNATYRKRIEAGPVKRIRMYPSGVGEISLEQLRLEKTR